MLKKVLFGFSAVLALLLLMVGIFYYLNFIASNINSSDAQNKESFIFIPKDASPKQVIDLLKKQNLLKNAWTLNQLMSLKNFSGKNIVPGKYKINNGISNNDLINHLRAGNGRLDSKIVFNQLRSLKEISRELSREIFLDSTQIFQWLSNSDSIGKYGFDKYTIYCLFIFVPSDFAVRSAMPFIIYHSS